MKLGVPWTSKGKKSPERPAESNSADAASVHDRLDDLARQLERLSRITAGDTLAQATPPYQDSPQQRPPDRRPERAAPDESAPPRDVERYAGARTINRNPLRPVYSQATLDQAMAEIAARQRALEIPPRPAQSHAAEVSEPSPPPPAQDLSGLEEQLRRMTAQIESLRRPCAAEDAVPALRQELSEISHALAEAMPRRAIEAIEADVRGLTARLNQSWDSGVDRTALANLEQGLAEVRDALHALRPAESLVGFQNAIQGVTSKIDTIVANHSDPMVLQQLESAITGLRGIVAHVASDDTLARLTEEVRKIAGQIERVASTSASSDALTNLERQIRLIAEAVDQSQAQDRQGPARLEAMVRGLAEKIEMLQPSRGDTIAFGQLEERIARLVEKLDVSGSRFSQLEAIERGLADILVHLGEQSARTGALRAADSDSSGVESLKRDLDAVNGTLTRIADRLTSLESGIRANIQRAAAPVEPAAAPTPAAAGPSAKPSAPPAATTPVPPQPAAAPSAPKAPVAAKAPIPPPAAPVASPSERLTAAARAQRPAPPRERPPIDPNLPPDHPLEPGAAIARTAPSPAERIAASEAALGPARPPANPEPGAKADFVAAARRAAQAASQLPPEAANKGEAADQQSLGNRLAGRVRSILVGTSVIILTLGAVRLTLTLIEPYTIAAPDAKQSAKAPEILPPQKSLARILPDPIVTGSTASHEEEAKAPDDAARAALDATAVFDSRAWTQPAPQQAPPNQEQADITSTIPPKPASRGEVSATPMPPSRPHDENQSPAEPKSRLAAAADAGDATAAYELAVRHIDGRGVRRSYEDAARWLAQASKDGLAPAQFRLGSLYEKGMGVKKDLQKARRLYTAAAEQGNAKAMHNLAVLYAEGIDGKPDYKIAVQWFRKAADRGVADSQYNLGVLYARGVGLDQNLAEAYKWFALAAQQGDQDAGHKRDDIGGRLDAESLMAARLAVKTWTVKPQPEEATNVASPPGGWDKAPPAPAAKRRVRGSSPPKLGPS